MELLSIPPHSTSASSTKVLVLDGTTAKSRTAAQLRVDGGGAAVIHAPTHAANGSDPLEISQSQVFDSLLQEDGSFLLTEDGKKLSTQGVDDIRPIITQIRTVSGPTVILGRKSAGSGFFEELTINDALEFIGATAQGDILYRGADGWDRLPAGTNGQFLRTQGTTGNPTWANISGSLADGDKGDITVSNTGATWTIDNQAVSYAKIQNISSASRILGRKSGTAGSAEECTLSEVLDMVGGAAHGDILYRGPTGWVRLGAGTNNQYLKTQGPNANPVWAAVSALTSQRHDFSFSRGESSTALYIPSSGSGNMPWPFQQNTVFTMFRSVFVPTNYQLTFMLWDEILASAVPNAVGLTIQYSTDGSSWNNIASLDVRGAAGFREFSGSMSLGSPANLYFRLLSYNSGFNSSVTLNQVGMMLSVWN